MNEAEFLNTYKQTLAAIEETVEAAVQADVDIDYESGNDMLTLMFNNGSVAIISRQSAIHQLWLAARSGGFHFEFNGTHWLCTIDGRSLQDMLSEICVDQGEIELSFY